jgi:hypothetical protein
MNWAKALIFAVSAYFAEHWLPTLMLTLPALASLDHALQELRDNHSTPPKP